MQPAPTLLLLAALPLAAATLPLGDMAQRPAPPAARLAWSTSTPPAPLPPAPDALPW